MKKIKLLLLFLLLSSSFITYSQNIAVGYRAELGTFSAKKFGDVLHYYSNLNLPVELTEDFPPYIIHRAELSVIWGRIKTGLFYQYLTSGARMAYSDYSGAIYYDEIVASRQYGLFLDYRIRKIRNFYFSGYTDGARSSTDLKLSNKIRLNGQANSSGTSDITYYTDGYTFEPGVKVSYPFNRFQLQVNCGYQFIFNGPLKYHGITCYYVRNHEMRGWRLGLQLDIKLFKQARI